MRVCVRVCVCVRACVCKTDHISTLLLLPAPVVERHKVCGQPAIKLLVLGIQHEEYEVEPTQECVRELNVFNDC